MANDSVKGFKVGNEVKKYDYNELENLPENNPDDLAEEVNDLKSDLNYNHTAEPGYVLRATDNGHGNEWAMVGTPTDAQAETAINKWLDDHPEATTTVQDWSLTYKKLVKNTLGFVIPQMYGAVGNGIADDTQAIQDALSASKNVFFPSGTYLIDGNNDGWGHQNEGGIFPQSGSTLIFANDAVLKAKANTNGFYNILNINSVSDVTIIGGKIHGEKNDHEGTSGEYGYGIKIAECENVRVSNMEIYDCCGDAIFVGSQDELTGTCNHITIDNCILHDCRRQGISVVIGEDIHINKCEIYNISGTLPMSAIDIESNGQETIKNVYIDECYFHDNAKASVICANDFIDGVYINNSVLSPIVNINGGQNIYIDKSKMRSVRSASNSVFVSNSILKRVDVESGNIMCSNCDFENDIDTELILVGVDNVPSKTGDYIIFDNCRFSTNSTVTRFITFANSGAGVQDTLLAFEKCTITLDAATSFSNRITYKKFILKNNIINLNKAAYQLFTLRGGSRDINIFLQGNTFSMLNVDYLFSSDATGTISLICSNNIGLKYTRFMYSGSDNLVGNLLLTDNILTSQYPIGVAGNHAGIAVTSSNMVT